MPDLNQYSRKLILTATHNAAVARAMRQYGMRLGAARFVAGESLDAAVPVLRGLNDQGLVTNTTLLGEAVHDRATVERVVCEYEGILDRIAAESLQTNVALKLTHLGLDIDEELAYQNVARLVAHAAEHDNFIRMDMEESARVEPTLRMYERLRAAGHENVGTVLQAYLYRTPDDLRALLPLAPNLRLVKGAYLEPPEVAYPKKADVDRAFMQLIKTSLQGAGYTAVATHDENIINRTMAFTEQHGIGGDRFEFQMLYGIRPQLQRELAERGYTVLVATPFGSEWYPFFMRRLAERPANVMFLAGNLVRG